MPANPPAIGSVRVIGGKLELDPSGPAYIYDLGALAMTVVAVEPNAKNDTLLIALTSAGSLIRKREFAVGPGNVHFYNITGVTIWVEFTSQSVLADPSVVGVIGRGPAALMPYIKIGHVLRDVGLSLNGSPGEPGSGRPPWQRWTASERR